MTKLHTVVSIIILTILITTAQVSAAPPQQSPAIEGIVNLGVPAGNGTSPSRLAINRQAGQLYILSSGIPALKQGNGLSVYDIVTGQITDHIKINQGDNHTLDLQFDSDSGLIYALWQAQPATDIPPTLTVIDSDSLRATQNISGIDSFAAGGGQLYATDSEQLTVYQASGNTLTELQRVELPQATAGPMAVDPNANRLYTARNAGGNWSVEIFEADTLQSVSSYPANGAIENILPLPGADQAFIVSEQAGVRVLDRITSDGELADLPQEMGPQQFNANGVALSPDSTMLYFSNGQSPLSDPAPAIIGIGTSDMLPQAETPLLTNVTDLVIGDDRAFGLNSTHNTLYEIDLTTNEVNIVKTAIEIKDVLADPDGSQLYVSDSAGRIRRLAADTLTVLAETQLSPDFSYQSAPWAGELTLDKERNRLYISGRPATVLEADTLAEVATLEPGGQLSPDPTGDNIYVSDCGLSIVDAPTLSAGRLVPGTDAQPLGLSPNPCVVYSQIDPQNQLLYSLAFNGTPGSNSGQYLYIYDVTLEPTLIFSDTEISFVQVEPDPAHRRAFTTWARHSNQRLRSLNVTADGPARYEQQLMGVRGEVGYSPGTDQLYLTNANRLLTLEAGTLAVLDELHLPANYNYRLADVNPVDGRLYLIGLDGNLLIAGPEGTGFSLTMPPPPAHAPTGDVLELHPTASGDILARIESNYDNTFDTRLYLTSDEGQSWQDLSQHLPQFAAQAAAAANDNTLLAGLTDLGNTGGLYTSSDGGQSWLAVMNGLRELWFDKIYLSPNFEQDRLTLVNTIHTGLHYSNNGGQSWTPLVELDANATFPSELQTAAVAFDAQGAVLVSQNLDQMRGIFKATQTFDGTLSAWEQLFDRPVDLLAANPDGQLVLAFGQGLWRSADGGQSWQAAGAGLTGLENHKANRLLFSPNFAIDQTVYFFFTDAVSGDLPARLFRSTDGGQQWQLWAAPLDDNNFTAIALASASDFIFGDSNSQLTRLAPSTIAWADPNQITTPFPFDDIAASPAFDVDQTVFVLSNERGLFKSTDGGQSWQITDFPARAYRPGVVRYRLALSPNYDQDQTLFVATGRSLHRSVDGGQSWEQLTPDAQQSFAAQKIALSPNFAANATLLVSTGDTLYRSSDGGDSWQQVLAADEASAADILAFAPDGSTAYARFGYTNNLHTSTDGGQSWLPQTSSIGEYFTMLDTATAPDNSLIGAMEFEGRVLQADTQSQPWRDFSAALPPELTTVQAVVYGPGNAVFIGGQGGVYRSADNGQSWQAAATGLPADADVTTLHATETHLFAALADGVIFVSADEGNLWQDISVVR